MRTVVVHQWQCTPADTQATVHVIVLRLKPGTNVESKLNKRKFGEKHRVVADVPADGKEETLYNPDIAKQS